MVNATTADASAGSGEPKPPKVGPKVKPGYKTVTEHLEQADRVLRDRYESLRAWIKALGDDIQENPLAYYVAFKRLKNFCCAEVRPSKQELLLYVKVDPSTIHLEEGFTRDVRKIGHYGTGDLEITIRSDEELEKAKPLILKSYEAS